LALFVLPAYSSDFKLIKVNSHYEPELKNREESAITLPDTDIKTGLYRYDTDDGGYTGKIGFLINKEKFYFLQSRRPEGKPGIEWQYGLAGDVTYGIYKNYFLLEASAGGTTRNSYLFLFKYDKNGVRFLDAITEAVMPNHEMLDFISSIKQTEQEILKYGSFDDNLYPVWEFRSPVWMGIEDIDDDGNPEIKLLISAAFKFEVYFKLYIAIREDRLRVDFNPDLYKPFFKQVKQKKVKDDQYYIYGFLAKELSLDKIKRELKDKQTKVKLKESRQNLIFIIENIGKLDEAFHYLVKDENFVLKQYDLKRR
jgi:hypothetical protein